MEKVSSMGSANSITVVGDRYETNDTNIEDLGCSVFVLADALGMKAMQFLASLNSTDKRDLQQIVMRIMSVQGVPDDVFQIYNRFLHWEQELFPNKEAFVAMLKEEQESDTTWTGALAWPGHIIRVEKTKDGKLLLWDPQRKNKEAYSLLLEEKRFPMILFTLMGEKNIK